MLVVSMARKSSDYWEKRNTEMMLRYEKQTEQSINTLIKAYNRAQDNIEKEIRNIFKNYAKDGVMGKEALKSLLNKHQSELYHESLLEIINTIDDSEIKKRLITKYNAPAYANRISRYEQLRSCIEIELKKLADIEKRVSEKHYENIIDDAYYRSIYNVQVSTGLDFAFTGLDTKTINLMLAENWNGANFSSRIWNNSEKLTKYLEDNFLGDYLSGKSIVKMSNELSEAMSIGMFQATRLLRTETNRFANESEMLAYEELDIEQYRYMATLDKVTCDHCGSLDNKIFNVKDRKTGINCPPLHPNDRCGTIPIIGEAEEEQFERIARNPVTGKNYYIDKNISYEEWRKQINEKYGEGTLELERKKYTNLKKDKEQYERYKDVIGSENLPKTFEKFQNLKYNDNSDYGIMKDYYKQYTDGNFPENMSYLIYKDNIENNNWQAIGLNPKKIEKHYEKHNKDFGFANSKKYEESAVEFINNKEQYETFTSQTGYVFVYDKKENVFADAKPNGIVETYFKPTKKETYWKEQIEKYGKQN